jgi:hypothetical protein
MKRSSIVAAAAAVVMGGALTVPLANKLSADEYRSHHHHFNYVKHVHVVTVPMCMPNDNPANRPSICNPPAPIVYQYQHHHTRYLWPETRYVFERPHHIHPAPKIREEVERVGYHHYKGHHDRVAGCFLLFCGMGDAD